MAALMSSYTAQRVFQTLYVFMTVGFIIGIVVIVHHFTPDRESLFRGGLPYVDPYRFVPLKNMTAEMKAIQQKILPGIKVQIVAYYVHVLPGCLYFIAGILQFVAPLRTQFPLIHRAAGYFYLFMQGVSTVGLLMITCTSMTDPTKMDSIPADQPINQRS